MERFQEQLSTARALSRVHAHPVRHRNKMKARCSAEMSVCLVSQKHVFQECQPISLMHTSLAIMDEQVRDAAVKSSYISRTGSLVLAQGRADMLIGEQLGTSGSSGRGIGADVKGGYGAKAVEAVNAVEVALTQAHAVQAPQLCQAARQLQRAAGVQPQLLQRHQPHKLLHCNV